MRKKRFLIAITLTLVALLVMAGVVLAQSGGEYDLSWSTIDGGGGTSEGGGYSLSGTIGQPDAGNSQGGDFTLDGGFWVKGILEFLKDHIYLPLIIKG